MSTGKTSTETPMESKKMGEMGIEEDAPKEELSPPVTELLQELWNTISVPFDVCCRVQRWTLILVIISYILYTLSEAGWPRDSYKLISEYCDSDHPQWTEDITYRQQPVKGVYLKGDILFPPEATWKYQNYVRGCPCKVKSCVRKCCPPREIYQSSHDLTCVEDERKGLFDNLEDNLYTTDGVTALVDFRKESLRKVHVNQTNFKVVSGFADCTKYIGVLGARYEVLGRTAAFMADGTALTEDGMFLDIDDYCMENTLQGDAVITVRCVKINLFHHPRFWTLTSRPTSEWVGIVISYGGFVATVFTFLFVPQLRNIHGTLAIGFVVVQAINFSQYCLDLNTLPSSLAYLWQFTYLMMFSWLTTFGVELWVFFCGDMRPRTLKMGAMYVLPATVPPTVLTALSWLVGVLPNLSDRCSLPRFQEDSCTFTMERTSRLFLYLPVGVMLLLNLILSMATSYNMNRVLQDTSGKPFLLSPCGRPHATARRGFHLCSKIFKIMILSVGCQLVLTTPFSQESPFFHHHISLLFYYQGLFLFLLIICDRQFFKPFYARFLEIHIQIQVSKQERKEKKRQKEQEEYEKYQDKKKRQELQKEKARERPA